MTRINISTILLGAGMEASEIGPLMRNHGLPVVETVRVDSDGYARVYDDDVYAVLVEAGFDALEFGSYGPDYHMFSVSYQVRQGREMMAAV